MSDRIDAIHLLIEQLKTSYPQKGLISIHPSVTFIRNDKGICVQAKKAIKATEVLLVIPDSARMSTNNVPQLFDSNKNKININLDDIMKEVEKKLFHILQNNTHEVPDHILSFVVMHALSNQGNINDTVFMKHAATMPSHLEMRNEMYMNLNWTEEQLNGIGGTNSFIRTQLERKQARVKIVFQKAILPILNTLPTNIQKLFIGSSVSSESCDFSKSTLEECLWETYLNTYIIVDSRSHGSQDDFPELIPLLDLFNGASEWNPEGLEDFTPRSNVALHKVKWPFTSGVGFDNECKISCSAIYALRDIDDGEEIVVSYGELGTSLFLLKYSAVPLDLFKLKKTETIELLCPPNMVPNDKRRILSLEQSGNFSVEAIRNGSDSMKCLSAEDYCTNQKGHETVSVFSLRFFLLLGSIGSDEEVEVHIQTGRLPCSVSDERMCRALCEVINYNLTILDPIGSMASSKEDFDRANSIDIPFWEKNALLSRICQRETLLMWRHHFCRRYKMLPNVNFFDTNHSIHKLLLLQNNGCKICGRTYPIMKCTICKVAIYCSKKHQSIDWRKAGGHKLLCGIQKKKDTLTKFCS